MIELNKIYNEDCLEGMKRIPDKSVDMILCDLPYGTTANKWDVIIPFDGLWEQYKRVIKDTGAIVLTSDEPFTSQLIFSNKRDFRYKWIWNKGRGSNFQNSRFMPMKNHEEICVFYKKMPTYNPQFLFGNPYKTKGGARDKKIEGLTGGSVAVNRSETISDGRRYPLSILKFNKDSQGFHPTQKPVALFEYLIKTYSNKGDTVLDNCMGSGTTAIACLNTERNFVGFETNKEYYNKSLQRIKNNVTQLDLFENIAE